jgi:hypothetical protein
MSGDFILPDGSRFDCGVGLGPLPPEGFSDYGGFMEETRNRLLRYGRVPKRVEFFNSIHAEVGDDEIDVSTSPVPAAAELAVYSKYLGVEVSEEDTSINPRFGNFAEDLVIVPDGYEQTYHYAQQTGNFRDMSFIDVPKLRLAIDIRPGRMGHSDTNDGKAGMLGSRLAWLPEDSPVRCLWEVFNLFQDINLGLMRDDKFAYLPTALGGYGKPIPFGHSPNFEAIIQRYKQGAHKELCRELVRRCNRRFRDYSVSGRYSADEVLSAVSRVQSSWHDWIKGNSLYAPACWLEAPPEVAQHRVVKHGEDTLVDSVARRLEASGHLVSEQQLAVAYEHNMLCQYLVGTETHDEFMDKRAEARKQWLNLSTFSLRLYGYIEKIGIDQSLHHVMEPREYEEFWLNITKRRISLRAFLRQEWFYDREAMKYVYVHGPMMVRVPLVPKVTQMGRRYWFEQTKDLQDHLEDEHEYDMLLEWLKGDRSGLLPSRALVEDDPWIIKEIKTAPNEQAFCVVTDDIALCRQAYLETRKWVVRVPTKWYYFSVYYGDGDEPWLARVKSQYPFYEWKTILDEGSIKSYEEIGFRDGVPIKWPVFRPFSLLQRSIKSGRNRVRAGRTEAPAEEDFGWEPYRFPDGYIFAPNNFIQRKSHPFRRGWA